MPDSACLCVHTGSIAGGESGGFLPGFPEFPGWLGKNSSKGKHQRLLDELHYHASTKMAVGSSELRAYYLPILRMKILKLLRSSDGPKVDDVIALMDDYGLSRADVFETIDEFCMTKKEGSKFSTLDSKVKSAFTRAYNAVAHKSQALVAEQGDVKKGKKRKKDAGETTKELGVVDDDAAAPKEDSDEEDDTKAIMEAFTKKRKKTASSKKKKKT